MHSPPMVRHSGVTACAAISCPYETPFYHSSKKCKFPRNVVKLPTIPYVFLYPKSQNFPSNGKIFWERHSQIPHFFEPRWQLFTSMICIVGICWVCTWSKYPWFISCVCQVHLLLSDHEDKHAWQALHSGQNKGTHVDKDRWFNLLLFFSPSVRSVQTQVPLLELHFDNTLTGGAIEGVGSPFYICGCHLTRNRAKCQISVWYLTFIFRFLCCLP